MRGIQADPRHEVVGGEVEDHQVVADVHVPVVVDPLGAHDVAVCSVEGRGEIAHEWRSSAQEIRIRLRATQP